MTLSCARIVAAGEINLKRDRVGRALPEGATRLETLVAGYDALRPAVLADDPTIPRSLPSL